MRHAARFHQIVDVLFESSMLLGNRGSQMEEDCRELLYRWPDARGQAFARGALPTLLGLRDQSVAASRAALESSRQASAAIQRSEALLEIVQARFGALEQLAHQTRSEGEQATHCANQARHRASAAQASADSGLAIIRALGSPPI